MNKNILSFLDLYELFLELQLSIQSIKAKLNLPFEKAAKIYYEV